MTHTAGLASLTNILVALVVVWTGFIKGTRSAWLVMLVIVGVWAFPIMVLPLLKHTISLSFGEWVAAAWRENGSPRIYLVNIVMFLLMLVGLVLPLKSLFWAGKPE